MPAAQPAPVEGRVRSPSRAAVAAQLLVFLLAVLPQAIKLFSMRGIPGTQLVAAAFLLSSMPNLLSLLRGSSPKPRVLGYVDAVLRGTQTPPNRFRREAKAAPEMLFIIGAIPHMITMVLLCDPKCGKLRIPLPADLSNLFDWLGLVSVSTGTILLPVAHLFSLYKLMKPEYCVLPVSVCCLVTIGGVLSGQQSREDCTSTWVQRISILAFLGAVSVVLAWALYLFASVFRAKQNEDLQQSDEADGRPPGGGSEHVEVDQQSPVEVVENPIPSRTYVNTGTQTASTRDSPQHVPAASDSSSSPVGIGPDRQDDGLEPWMMLAIYWSVKIFAIDVKKDDFRPETRDQGVQTGSSSCSGAEVDTETPCHEDSHGRSCVFCIINAPIFWIAKHLGCLYLAIVFLGKRPKQTDGEAATVTKTSNLQVQVARPLWKTALLWVVWTMYYLVSGLLQQYSLVGNYVEAMFKLHNGEIMWVAFGISNMIAGAVYYIVLFDNRGTTSPSWVTLLGK